MKTPEQLRRELGYIVEDLKDDVEPDHRRELEARARTIKSLLNWFAPEVRS